MMPIPHRDGARGHVGRVIESSSPGRRAGGARSVSNLLFLACALAGAQMVHGAEPLPEYQVKAAWLLNFARFVEWPADRFTSAEAPFVVGIVGEDPFGLHLESTFAGKTVKGRSFLIKRLDAGADLTSCHLVFFSSSERRKHREMCDGLRQAAVLTVGDTADFADNGGMIGFVRKDNAIRFHINFDVAQPAGLSLSAQLLKVALSVRGRYKGGRE
ncbi:MAG TPA: YfiR family protein [Methylomirabilota bacterium]|nr:YfiR family protein [Methylomirabilota bacterium]